MLSAILLAASLPPISDTVVYEVNLRAYGPDHAFRHVESALPRLKRLGINVVWLMPIYPVGQIRSAGGLGSPYAVKDYLQVNPEFGTKGDFEELVATAHRDGMAVILDWVANHTAWDNPWLAHKEWYVQDANGNVVYPPGTNWRDVAKLNYSNHSMREAMESALKYWFVREGVDGFRCDDADQVPADFWAKAISDLRATGRPLLMLAEGNKPSDFQAGFDLDYGWDFYTKLRQIFDGKAPATSLRQTDLEEHSGSSSQQPLRFTTNHDMCAWDGSPIEQFHGLMGHLAAFAVTAFYGGVPLVYTGQEIGWPERIPFLTDAEIDWGSHSPLDQRFARLLELRAGNRGLRVGAVTDYSSDEIIAFERGEPADVRLVIVNPTERTVGLAVPGALHGQWFDLFGEQPTELGDEVRLRPYQVMVLKRR